MLVKAHNEIHHNPPVLLPAFDFTADNYQYWVDGYKFDNELLYATTLNAERVIFYCYGTMKYSPYLATEYLKFLQENHPESRQKVNVVKSGVFGIFYYMEQLVDSKMLKKEYFKGY